MGKMGRDGALVQGTLDMLILRTLARGPDHGFGIAKTIHLLSAEVLRVEEGSLYPALHRLELSGLLAAEWGQSDSNRRARFYRLTPKGRRRLEEEKESWERLALAISRVMDTA